VTGRDDTTAPGDVAKYFTAVHQLVERTTRDTRHDPELTARLLNDIGVTIADQSVAAGIARTSR
jgi:hypothetical protein